jgi:hypothetical protein
MKRLSVVCAALGFTLCAANVDEFKRDCDAFKKAPGLNTFKSCLADLFTLQPIHPIVRTVVPGSGYGAGLNYTLDSPKGEWHRVFTVDGAATIRSFWLAETKFSLTHPKFGGDWNTARDAFATHFYLRAMDLPKMPFYGVGPNTSRSNLVDFAQRDVRIGADIVNPIASWVGIGGTLEGIFPDVSTISDPKVRSIQTVFNETTAPGLLSQPTFVHSEFFVNLHHADPVELSYRVGYNFYHDTSTGHYSFRRFRADLRHNIYPERSNAQPHRDSVLSLRALFSASDTSASNAVPFYLMETLGGSDINGDAGLRGFQDYRFRGPDLMLFQAQYERRLWKIFGVLAFYDIGKVANRAGDLDFTRLRHSYGFGGNVWLGSKVVFRAYVGLGGGEGVHPYFGIPIGL